MFLEVKKKGTIVRPTGFEPVSLGDARLQNEYGYQFRHGRTTLPSFFFLESFALNAELTLSGCLN